MCKHRRKRELREIFESIDYLKQHFRIDFWVRKFGIIGGEEKKMLCVSSPSNIPSQRILVSFSWLRERLLQFQLVIKIPIALRVHCWFITRDTNRNPTTDGMRCWKNYSAYIPARRLEANVLLKMSVSAVISGARLIGQFCRWNAGIQSKNHCIWMRWISLHDLNIIRVVHLR